MLLAPGDGTLVVVTRWSVSPLSGKLRLFLDLARALDEISSRLDAEGELVVNRRGAIGRSTPHRPVQPAAARCVQVDFLPRTTVSIHIILWHGRNTTVDLMPRPCGPLGACEKRDRYHTLLKR